MGNLLKKFLWAESGAAAAEYALLVALIGAGIAIAGADLGAAISIALTSASGSM